MTLEELCNEMSISTATGKNWLKLGKIQPQSMDGAEEYFSTEYVIHVKETIWSGESAALKSRRNKKYVSGNALYRSYVSDDCKSAVIVGRILRIIQENEITLNEKLLRILVAECALQLLVCRQEASLYLDKNMVADNTVAGSFVESYLNGQLQILYYSSLTDSLLESIEKTEVQKYICQYPQLFSIQYDYEERGCIGITIYFL